MGGQQFPSNLSGLVVAGMLILAALHNPPPLTSDRPPPAQIEAEPSGPFEDVPARIWEDPLEAAARAPKARAEPTLRFDARCVPSGREGDSASAEGPPAAFARCDISSSMPRLVLVPTNRCVSVTALRIVSPSGFRGASRRAGPRETALVMKST